MTKVLVQTGQGANYHIRASLVNAFRACGYPCYFWDDSAKSAFDVFAEFEPNFFIGSTWQLNRPLVKCLAARPKVKTVLYGDIYGYIQQKLDLTQYPVGIATDEQKDAVEKLLELGGNAIIVSNHGPKDVLVTHNGWRDAFDLQVYSLLVSADLTQYFPRESDDRYKTELAYVGGYWPYKSRNIDKYLMPLLYPNTKDWRIRLFGSGWNVVQSLGGVSIDEEAKHYSNASIVPHLVEPHCSDVYQDLPLRYFQVAACGGFAISCPCVAVRDVFAEDELVVAESPEDFFEKVVFYLNNPDLTESFRKNALRRVVQNHSGFHRVVDLLRMLDEPTTVVENMINQLQVEYGY